MSNKYTGTKCSQIDNMPILKIIQFLSEAAFCRFYIIGYNENLTWTALLKKMRLSTIYKIFPRGNQLHFYELLYVNESNNIHFLES